MRLRLAIATLVALGALAAPASAVPRAEPARPFEIGFADSLFGTEDGGVWAARTARAGADAVRVNLYWSLVAPNEPQHPRQPDDPAYDWQAIDRAVIAADSHGLDVLMTVLAAPAWAEGPRRPSFELAPAGTWRPDPGAYGDFAHAVAERYSGFHPVPDDLGGAGSLPEVDLFAAWNEPNITAYLAPQYAAGENVSPEIYARLLDAFYTEVKAVNPAAVVSTGGTAPFGDPVAHRRTAPLAFWRGVMCLTPTLDKDLDCPIDQQPRFDILAHHPISYLSSPAVHAAGTDDMTVADIGELGKALRAAEAERTIGPAETVHRMIVPEIWWESRPGERRGISARMQARYTALAMYLLWKRGVDGVWFLQVRDAPPTPGSGGKLSSYQTGIYTYGGRRKPVYSAIRFPLVTERIDRRSVLAWGRAPRSGTLRLQVQRRGHKRWRAVSRRRIGAGSVFASRIDVRGSDRVRARIGPTKSLPWRQGRGRPAYSPPR